MTQQVNNLGIASKISLSATSELIALAACHEFGDRPRFVSVLETPQAYCVSNVHMEVVMPVNNADKQKRLQMITDIIRRAGLGCVALTP
jgi:hypothetical protein